MAGFLGRGFNSRRLHQLTGLSSVVCAIAQRNLPAPDPVLPQPRQANRPKVPRKVFAGPGSSRSERWLSEIRLSAALGSGRRGSHEVRRTRQRSRAGMVRLSRAGELASRQNRVGLSRNGSCNEPLEERAAHISICSRGNAQAARPS